METTLPRLITFDGEARSGKGTIVGMTKDYLRDEQGRKVMLIDGGQLFRVLTIALTRADINLENPEAIDTFLSNEQRVRETIQLVKDVYRMTKDEREALLYTSSVSEASAKIGARPRAQEFKDNMLRKWFTDAANEGFDTVLFDGRALEETGKMLAQEGLCDYILGFYFVCDPLIAARRSLGYGYTPYEELDELARYAINELADQINTRNGLDRTRITQPLVKPLDTPEYKLPSLPITIPTVGDRPMAIIDTSADLPIEEKALSVARLVANYLV